MWRSVLLHCGIAALLSGCAESAESSDASRDVVRRVDSMDAVSAIDVNVGIDISEDILITSDITRMDSSPLDADVSFSDVSADSRTDGDVADTAVNNCVMGVIPRPFGTSCAPGLVCDGAGACAIRRPCAFESAGRWLYPSGMTRRLLETIFAYGRYYNFWINPDGTYEPLNAGGNDTTDITYWLAAGGVCAGVRPCSIASFDIIDAPDGAGGRTVYQSVTRGGRLYLYDVTAVPRMVSAGLLEGIPRFSTVMMGPCASQPEGDCNIDSRSLVHNWGTGQLIREEVTTQGRRWVWDGAGRPVASVPLGQRLDDVTRYAPIDGMGPCSARGLNCRFDAHFHDPSSGDEYVIAAGRLYAWANDAENTRRYAAGYANELHTFARYATGPCRVR